MTAAELGAAAAALAGQLAIVAWLIPGFREAAALYRSSRQLPRGSRGN